MPLTAQESPPETNLQSIQDTPVAWACVVTHPNREKDFVRHLPPETPYVLPYIATTDAHRKITLNPLFASYVFVGQHTDNFPPPGTPVTFDAFLAARSTKRMVALLPVANQNALRLQLALLTESPPEKRTVRPEANLYPGALVRFNHNSGCYGVLGTVEKTLGIDKKQRLRVSVRMVTLGRVVSLETTADMLETAE